MTISGITLSLYLLLTSAGGSNKAKHEPNYIDSLRSVNDTLVVQRDSINAFKIQVDKKDSL